MSQKGMSLRWRMILIIVGIPLLLVVTLFGYVVNRYRDAYRQAYWEKGDLITVQLQDTLETITPYVRTFEEVPGLAALLQKNVENNKEFNFIALVDKTGRVLQHSTPAFKGATLDDLAGLDRAKPVELRHTMSFGTVYLISRAIPMPNDASNYLYIVVGERAEMVNPPLTALFIVVFLGAGGLIALLYFSIQRFILRPLTQLAEGARIIGGGNLTHTIPIERNDEIGMVAQAFNTMASRLRELVDSLEQRIQSRTAALERRSTQLQSISLVSKEIAQLRNLSLLLETTVRTISERFGFYHAAIFILDDTKTWAVLRAASSAGGQRMLARGHRLQVGQTGIVGLVAGSGKPRIALNVGEDMAWFGNPDLPETRSEIALPLLVENEVIGVLDVQSDVAGAFTDEDISTLQLLADQLAIALNNARSLEAMEAALAEVHALQVEYSRQGWARIAAQVRPLAYEYDHVDVSPVPPLPVPVELRTGQVSHAQIVDGGVPVMMEALRAGDRLLGYLGLADSRRVWSAEELSLVESVGEQVALALENARLFEESQQSQRQQTLISNVLQVASTPDLDFETVLTEITRILAQALDMAVGIYTFPAPNLPRLQPHAVLSPSGERLPFPDGFLSLREEHSIFLRGLQHVELGPLQLVLGDTVFAPEEAELLSAYDLARAFYVPLGSGSAQRGFIVLLQPRANVLPLDPETRDLIRRLASQIEVILDNLTLTEETQQRSEELRSLYNISLALSELLEPDDVLDAIVQQGLTLLRADSGGFFSYDAESDTLVLTLNYPPDMENMIGYRLRRGEGLVGKALAEQQTLFIENYNVWEESIPGLRDARFNAIMAVPLIGRFGPQGVLSLRAYEMTAFSEREVRLANLFAQQAAAALDNARLNKDAQRRAEEFSLLSQAGIDLLPIRDMERLLDRAADWTRRIFDVPRAVIFLRHPDTGVYMAGRSVDAAEHLLSVTPDNRPSPGGLTETIMETRKGIIVQDTRLDSHPSSRQLAEIGLLSRMGVPLRVGDDIAGAVFVSGSAPNQFNERDLNMLEFLATQVSSAIQNALQFGRTEQALGVVRRQARYQANVSQATALLTERGTEAVGDVLRLLGEAAGAEGVLYMAYHSEETMAEIGLGQSYSFWQTQALWTAASLPPDKCEIASAYRIPLEEVQSWADQLIGKPYLVVQSAALSSTERELLQSLGFNSILVLTVRGDALYPNIILVGRVTAEAAWLEEEIVALQTAAAALSNTIARERVFEEVQASRTETEALYRGSAELNLAQTYDGILNVVRAHTVLGEGAQHITMHLFDRPWREDEAPTYSEVVAHWTTDGPSALRQRFYINEFKLAQELARNPGMTVFDDVEHDPRFSRRERALFSRIYHAKSVVFVPLIASGQRIGFLHAMYPEAVRFSEQERRRLESLTQQAAIAAQNRLQLLTIEARVNRERMIREITERIQAAPDVEGVLQAAVRELGRAFGTSRNRIQFRPPRAAEETNRED